MGKRKQPDTSLAAYHSLDQSDVAILKSKIIEALKVLGKGTSEQLADHIGEEYDRIWKRCSDLKNEKKIYASDHKVLTKKNRFARQWMICDGTEPKTQKEVRERLKKTESVADISRKITTIVREHTRKKKQVPPTSTNSLF